MPLITIQAFQPADPQAVSRMLAETRDEGARVFECGPGDVWVLFSPVQPGHYLQGGPKTEPAIVVIRAKAGRTPERQRALAQATAEAVARGLSLPRSRVWVHYQELRPEDVHG